MGQLGALYAEGRNRFIDVVSGLDDEEAGVVVPTCPAWTVKDTVSHVTGICADILAGRLDGVATDPWTEAQVRARSRTPIGEVIAEWQETGPQIDAIIDSFGAAGKQLLLDLTSHEYDVRHALGRPGRHDLPVFELVMDFMFTADDGALTIETPAGTWHRSGNRPPVTLRAEPFDVVRAFTGRRSRAQVAAMDWSDDPSPWLATIESGIFRFSEHDVVE